MTAIEIANALGRVAALAFTFGVGIPFLFVLGMRCHVGEPIRNEQGVIVADRKASPQMRALGWLVYLFLAVAILVAISWIAKDSLNHYFGLDLFPGLSSKH